MDHRSVSSASASFYETSFEYVEENTTMLYKTIKLNLQEIEKGTKELDTKLKNIRGGMVTTMTLLNAIETKSELEKS